MLAHVLEVLVAPASEGALLDLHSWCVLHQVLLDTWHLAVSLLGAWSRARCTLTQL